MSMTIALNGAETDVPDGATLPVILELLEFDDPRGVAIAVDGEVVNRNRWDATVLREGQKIEVLRAVQGG